MVARVRCAATNKAGNPCRMAPLTDSKYCWAHDPNNADAAAEARKAGGLRNRKEGTIAGVYGFQGLTTIQDIRRLLDVAAYDTLALDNGIARSRTLVSIAVAAAKLLEEGEMEDRLRQLERALLARDEPDGSKFDDSDGQG